MNDQASQALYYIVPPCHEAVGILYQDADILLVNKPAFLLSVPGRGPENRDSVFARLQEQFPGVRLIHRLDLDTSGMMVFALTAEAQKSVSRAFQYRQVSKRYDAIVQGLLENDEGEISLPLVADWPNRPRQKVCHETGKQALTRYRVVHRNKAEGYTHLQLFPHTGRSHQLRIHCREIGHAILGCDLYAPDAVLARSPRLLLHASYLAFNHPRTGLWCEFHCPADIETWLKTVSAA